MMMYRGALALVAGFSLLAGVARAEPLPVRSFAQLPRTQQVEISPDGTRIATLSNLGGRFGIVISSLANPNAKPIRISAPSNALELRWIKWANDEYLLAGLGTLYRRVYLDDRYRETRLYSIKADGSQMINAVRPGKEEVLGSKLARTVAELVALQQDNVIDLTPQDSATVLLSIHEDQREANSVAVRKVDVATGHFSYVIKNMRDIDSFSTDVNGEVRLGWGSKFTNGTINRFFAYKGPGGWVRREKSLILQSDYDFLDFTQDPKFAVVLGPVNGKRALLKWDMEADIQSEVLYQNDQAEVESVFVTDHSRSLYAVKLSDESMVYLDNIWSKRMRGLARALPNLTLEVESSSLDQKKFIIRATSATEPGVLYLFDEQKKSLDIVEYAYAGIGPENLASREWVSYKSRDGLRIDAVLTRPRNAPKSKPLPTVMLPHGGPIDHDKLEFDWLAQFIADRGYMVIQPNFRGSDGYGKSLLDAGDKQWGLAMQDDLTDGLTYLVSAGLADAKRVCIVGGSYGGYAALWGAVKDPDQYRCSVSLNGVSDIIALLQDDIGHFKYEPISRRIGDLVNDRDALKATSPINFVDKIKAPILLVHSRDDGRVDIKQSRRMADKLKAAGKVVEFIEVEKGEHFLENEASRITFLTALEGFLAKHLAP
jgi:acetyl esterase/lipase